jgi:hypothetical protein
MGVGFALIATLIWNDVCELLARKNPLESH